MNKTQLLRLDRAAPMAHFSEGDCKSMQQSVRSPKTSVVLEKVAVWRLVHSGGGAEKELFPGGNSSLLCLSRYLICLNQKILTFCRIRITKPRRHRSRKRNCTLPEDQSSRKVCARNVEISGPRRRFAFGLLLIINPVVCRFFRFGTLLAIERLQDHGQ
jgi:hypothetical protein